MKFVVTRTSDLFEDNKREVEINTIEDLEKLQKEYETPLAKDYWKNPSLIVNFNNKTIEVYDYYRE